MLQSFIPRPKDTWVIPNSSGTIRISQSAMADLIAGCTNGTSGLKMVTSTIRIEGNAVWADLLCELIPGKDLSEITPIIKSAVIQAFKKYCEIDVKEVKVHPKPKGLLDALFK